MTGGFLRSLPLLTSHGHVLDASENCFGRLRSSAEVAGDFDALRRRIEEDGYVYLPGYLDCDQVLEARYEITRRLAEKGLLDPARPHIEAVARPGVRVSFRPDLARENPPLLRLLYSGRVMDFYRQFLGGPVRHFDFTWFRAVGPGQGTPAHCDLVYMGRGTHNLYTAWIPYGDVPLELGGLIVLEKSHLKSDRIKKYLERDVDSYCLNGPTAPLIAAGQKAHDFEGWLSKNPVTLRAKLGGRWLTAEFRAGDFLTFKMTLVHASLDNHTDRIRLSSDSRYQRAEEAVDERWVGDKPVGHGLAGKRGRVC
jgi:hypothetical protein